MPHIETTSAFIALSLLLAFTPGPDNLFVVMLSASQGKKAGLVVVLGLCTGLIVHTVAVALGLAAVFATSAIAFSVFKVIGAVYLAWLAWQAYRAPVSAPNSVAPDYVPLRRLYIRGIVMNVTNPKVALFFLAFLPPFVDPKLGSITLQLLWFGFVFILSALFAFGGMTYLAAYFGKLLLGSTRARRVMNRLTAAVFAGLALRLATAQR